MSYKSKIILVLIQTTIIYSQKLFHNERPEHKYIDIYTNYPNLEEVVKDEKYLDTSENDTQENNPDSTTNYRPAFVKIQSKKYTDPDSEDYEDEDYQHYSRRSKESHVQKISSRSMSDINSKQLEPNENFFSKINSAIRNQFSRLFKFGAHKNGTIPSKTIGNARSPSNNKIIDGKLTGGKRFLNLFTVLQFENSRCSAQSGDMSYEGTCYHRFECSDRDGVAMGACAKGYGVCCIFRYTCGGTTSQNTSYFECDTGNIPPTTVMTTMPPTVPSIDPRINITAFLNRYQLELGTLNHINQNQELELGLMDWNSNNYGPEGRQNTGGTCVFTVNKRKADVKQLRIDFEDFDIRGPTNGVCTTDRLIISGGNINNQIPIICGYNTGQHIYVDVSDVPGPIQLSVLTSNPLEKRFRIKVSQIRAPCANFMNCLQYYTGPTGIVESLNYSPSPRGLGPAQYFNNLNYAICIRKEPGYCSITYSNVRNGVESSFNIINNDNNGNMLIPPGQAGVEIFNCPDDYIVINGIRLCGEKFNDGSSNVDFRQNAPVTDTSGGPFIIPVRTNGNNVARGFKLFYTQNRC